MSSITTAGGRHLASAASVRLVPRVSRYSPNGRTGLISMPAVVARHAATASALGAAVALGGSSVAAVALMLGLGR